MHAANVPAVNRQLNATPGSPSPNEKDGVVSLLAEFGPPLIVGVGGGVVSIVHVWDVELSFPAASVALTKKVYVPSPSV